MNHEFSIDGLFDFLNAGVRAFHRGGGSHPRRERLPELP